VHRDLKCDNIFINSHKGHIMIGDLGYASILSNHVTGSVLGTPEYMAPEIFQGEYDISIDIYSFGMCVLEMSTHLSPFYDCKGNPYQVYMKVTNGLTLVKHWLQTYWSAAS
jgi:WNK lysine deficient protein kinase